MTDPGAQNPDQPTNPAFPRDFWWGIAASATQCEGSAPGDTWETWERAHPDLPRSGTGNGFATRYAEDFAQQAELGLEHHRLTLDWARLEPEPGRRNHSEIERYRQILHAARDAGLRPWACLHHFSLPTWFAGRRGFANRHLRTSVWPAHVDFVADTFGDLVYGWQPVNEPLGFAGAGWLAGAHPPGIQDYGAFAEMLECTHLAAVDAGRRLRGSGPVASVLNLVPHYPAGDDALDAHRITEDLYWSCWMRMFTDGVLAIPGREPVPVKDITSCLDIIGFSYYMARTVHADLSRTPYPPGARVTERGDAVWSEGLGVVIDRLTTALPGVPLLVAEHGVGTTDDELRCATLEASLALTADRIAAGADVRGFFHWTGVDNYEWEHGWNVPFGCITPDRQLKPSAKLLAQHARRGAA